jgi:hypothetical protein
LFYFFLKLLRPHISEKREILADLVQNTRNPDQQIRDHVAAIYFVQHFVPAT